MSSVGVSVCLSPLLSHASPIRWMVAIIAYAESMIVTSFYIYTATYVVVAVVGVAMGQVMLPLLCLFFL